MKKTVSIKLIAVLLAVLVPLLMDASGSLTYTATYSDMPTIGTRSIGGVTYTTVKYGDLYNIGEPGKPSLPVDYIMFSVPCNATNFSVTATPVMSDPIALDNLVCPIQSSAAQNTLPDASSYNSSVYPASVAWYANDGVMEGENLVVTVAVMPLRMEIVNGNCILRQVSNVQLTLHYDLADTLTIRPIIRLNASKREEGYEKIREMVVNPEDVMSNSASLSNHQLMASLLTNPTNTAQEQYSYLIITTPELLKPLRRIVALRNQKGIKVKMVTVNEAINDTISTFSDFNAYRIREYLRTNWENNGIDHVLFAGTEVPFTGGSDYFYSHLDDIPTGMRSYPMLSVSRLLGLESKQFDNYTEKLLRYELNPGNGDLSYLQNAMFIESFDCETFGPLNEGFFPNCTDLSGLAEVSEYTGNDVLNMINQNHYGFISSFNNAYPSVSCIYNDFINGISHYLWAIDTVRPATGVSDSEVGNGLNRMNNKYYPMIFLAGYGATMPFDPLGYTNYGESFTMGKDYGGPAFFGFPETPGAYSASCAAEMILQKLERSCQFGEAVASTRVQLSAMNTYQTNYIFEDVLKSIGMLGDPLIRMWNSLPQLYSNISVSRTDNGVSVTGINLGAATVAYHSNDGQTGSVAANSSTVTLDDVNPNSTIMVYDHNRIPYIAPLILQNTTLDNSQYVYATDVTAGRSVDSGRTNGNVTIAEGIEYEIEASGKVTLAGGFNVERGAMFTVQKSTYK